MFDLRLQRESRITTSRQFHLERTVTFTSEVSEPSGIRRNTEPWTLTPSDATFQGHRARASGKCF